MISRILIIAAFVSTSAACFGQKGYTQYIKQDGLRMATKWAKAKDADGAVKPALLIAIENTNKEPVAFSYTINLYYEGMLRETASMSEECIVGLKSRIGKLNGIYFIPQKFTPEQLKSSDFNFTMDGIEIEKVDSCPDAAAE